MPVIVPQYIESLKPYVAGKPIEETQREYGVKRVVKLASNENPLGPSPKAQAAIRSAIKNLHYYPDPAGFHLRNALAKREGVSFDEIVLGNGSNEIMEFIFRTYCIPGDRMVAGQGVFAAFPISARIQGVETTFVPLTRDMKFDLGAMVDEIKKDPRVKVVAIPNPNNPTGTYNTTQELTEFLDAVWKIRDGSVQVILDYAYWEFVTAKDLPNPIPLYKKYENVTVLKTFSKIYGLGGLRLGYGIIHTSLAKYVQKVRMPFNVSSLALSAGLAALNDKVFVKKTLTCTRQGLKQFSKIYDKLDIRYLPSQGNFYLIQAQARFGKPGLEVFDLCLRQGLIVRPVANYGLPEWLRVSIGTESENRFAEKVIKKVLKDLGRA